MRAFLEDGTEIEVPDAQDDTKAELERVKEELARTQQTVTRLASKPGMEDTPEPTPAEEGLAAFAAEKAKGRPDDYAQASFVRGAREATAKQAAKQRAPESIAARVAKLKAEIDAIQADV